MAELLSSEVEKMEGPGGEHSNSARTFAAIPVMLARTTNQNARGFGI